MTVVDISGSFDETKDGGEDIFASDLVMDDNRGFDYWEIFIESINQNIPLEYTLDGTNYHKLFLKTLDIGGSYLGAIPAEPSHAFNIRPEIGTNVTCKGMVRGLKGVLPSSSPDGNGDRDVVLGVTKDILNQNVSLEWLRYYIKSKVAEMQTNSILDIYPFWKNKDGLGNILIPDLSANKLHASIIGEEYALLFDGVDDYGQIADHSSIQNPFDGSGGMVGAWINPKSDGESNLGITLSKNSWDFYVREESNGFCKLAFTYSFSTSGDVSWVTTNAVIPLNIPSFICVKYDADSVSNDPTFYIYNAKDGFQTLTVGSGIDSASPAGTRDTDVGNNMRIGNAVTTTNRTFDGNIYDSFVISTGHGEALLTAAQLESHAKLNDLEDTLFTARYKADEGTGTSLANSGSGEAAAATVSGATWKKARGLMSPNIVAVNERLKGIETQSADEHRLIIPYDSTHSFGDGATDSAFSYATAMIMDGSGTQMLLAQGVDGSNYEINIYITSAYKIRITLKDDSAGGIIYSVTTDSFEDLVGKICTIGFSYDGGGAHTGLKIYVNGVIQAESSALSGSYTAMENLSHPLIIGSDGGSSFLDSKIIHAQLFSDEKDADFFEDYHYFMLGGLRVL